MTPRLSFLLGALAGAAAATAYLLLAPHDMLPPDPYESVTTVPTGKIAPVPDHPLIGLKVTYILRGDDSRTELQAFVTEVYEHDQALVILECTDGSTKYSVPLVTTEEAATGFHHFCMPINMEAN